MPFTTIQEIGIGVGIGLLSPHRHVVPRHNRRGQTYARRLVGPCLQISYPVRPDMALLVFVPLVHLGLFYGFVGGDHAAAGIMISIILWPALVLALPHVGSRCRMESKGPLSIELLCRSM